MADLSIRSIRTKTRDEAGSGFAPCFIVLMSLRPAIPRRVGLHQSPPPLYQPTSMLNPSAETVNHHLTRAGDFSTARMGNFQPVLTGSSIFVPLVCVSDVLYPSKPSNGRVYAISGRVVAPSANAEEQVFPRRYFAGSRSPSDVFAPLYTICLAGPGVQVNMRIASASPKMAVQVPLRLVT